MAVYPVPQDASGQRVDISILILQHGAACAAQHGSAYAGDIPYSEYLDRARALLGSAGGFGVATSLETVKEG